MDYTWALNQTAVYWKRLGPDGYGDWLWEDPVEIDVRWDDVSEMFTDVNGEQRMSLAKVLVNQDVKVGDYLYLGDLDDIDSAITPANTKTAYRVQKFDKIPDLSGQEFFRRAWV